MNSIIPGINSQAYFDGTTALKKKVIENRYETTPQPAKNLSENQQSLPNLPEIKHRTPSVLEYKNNPEEYLEESPVIKNGKNFFHARSGSTQDHNFSSVAGNQI